MYFKKSGISTTWSGAFAVGVLIWFAVDFLGIFLNLFLSIFSFEAIPAQNLWSLRWFSPLPYFWLKMLLCFLLGGGFVGFGIVGLWAVVDSWRQKDLRLKKNILKEIIFSISGILFSLGCSAFAYGAALNVSYWLSRQSQASIQVDSKTHQLEIKSHLGFLPVSTKTWSQEEIGSIEVGNYRYQRTIKGSPTGYQVVRCEIRVHLRSGENILIGFAEWQIPWYQKDVPPQNMVGRPEVNIFCERIASQLGVPCYVKEDSTSLYQFPWDFIRYP